MLTYCLLALAAMFMVNRWVQFYKIKRNGLSLERIDADLLSRLNDGEPHDK
ncbi:MAG: hypothetical protein K0S39_172 [Paenibacillus sp.]|jgi:hypothetical protein|nr:hypothetical protein [Paenibacillus sp.]